MSTRSQQIRASPREKQARKWGVHEKTAPGAIRDGLKSSNSKAYSGAVRCGLPAKKGRSDKSDLSGRRRGEVYQRDRCVCTIPSALAFLFGSVSNSIGDRTMPDQKSTTRRPRRCRCQYCDSLYLPTEGSGIYGVCGRCASLWMRLLEIYPDRAVDVDAKLRAILADPLGQETHAALTRERANAAIDEATPYELAVIEQKITRLKKAALREKFTLIRGGREA